MLILCADPLPLTLKSKQRDSGCAARCDSSSACLIIYSTISTPRHHAGLEARLHPDQGSAAGAEHPRAGAGGADMAVRRDE